MENVEVVSQQGEHDKTEAQALPVQWTESEWFKVWLRLAKRDYHGRIPHSKSR